MLLFFFSTLSFLSGDALAMFLTKSINKASTYWCEFSLSYAHFWKVFFLFVCFSLWVQSTLENDRTV